MASTFPRCSAAVFGVLSLACSTAQAAARPAQDPGESAARPGLLDLEKVFELSKALTLGNDSFSGWLPEGQAYLATQNGALVRVDAESGQAEPHFDPARAEQAFAALPGIGAELAAELAGAARESLAPTKDAALVNACGDLFHYRLHDGRAVRLTHDPLEEVGESLSPDGELAAYISNWNLHLVPTGGGTPRPLTTQGDENHLYGRLDWVYQEELYGRGNFQGFWWSPDSQRIACLILDETEVPPYTIPDHRKTRPEVEVWRYPKAGDPNPRATLAVLDVAGGAPSAVDLSRYGTEQILIVRCTWTPDGSAVILQVQDRIQTWLDVVAADPKTGETRVLFRERTPTWVEPTDAPFWIEVERDGQKETQLLWLSERDGWRHLYRYDLAGTLVDRVTEGRWEVDAYHGYDAAQGALYFSGDRADVKGQQLFRVGLDGGGLAQVTAESGTHAVTLAPDSLHFTDTFSSHTTPTRRTLCRIGGEVVRTLDEVDPEPFTEAGVVPPEFHVVPTRDGFEMNAMLIKPAGFDPARRYPVLCHTYGGPHAPLVKDAWLNFNGLFHQMLAQEGYLIWTCDNRSASGMGLESAATVYKNLGPLELADLEDGVAWLVEQGLADPERIGLWGWSYGGFLTGFALTHSEVFKAGIVGAPVTDWRLYDTIYTERYMDTPQSNPEGYARTSVVAAAEKLHGKALILHGVIDENVHMQNSLQLAQGLQEAGHLFELMLYPGNRHGIVAPKQKQHLYATMADFIRREL